MKQILLAYLFVSLLGIAALSLLSYGHGPGYVYLYWRNWQVQTSLWILAALLVTTALSCICCGMRLRVI